MVKFPKDVATADRRFAQLWDDDYPINGDWLNRFAETSAQAMVRRDERTLNGHLAVMLNAYQRGGAYLRNLIDVNYMEDLFYQIEDADAQWGWRRVPPPLRQLYIDMWSGLITKFVTRLQPPDAASL